MPRGRPALDQPGDAIISVRHADETSAVALAKLAQKRKVSQATILRDAIHDYVLAQADAGDVVAKQVRHLCYERTPARESTEELQKWLAQHVAENVVRQQRRAKKTPSGDE